MPDSPIQPHPLPKNNQTSADNNNQQQQNMKTENQKRLCDFCAKSTALLYCRADSAKLCIACDREVHSTNQLFTKHTRWQLCDICDSSPASIFCSTERSVLCQNCDFETHNCLGSSLVHDRRPLEGFNGCPSLSDLSTFVGFIDVDSKSLLRGDESENTVPSGGIFDGSGLDDNNDDVSDFLFWGTPAIVSIDELIVSANKDNMFQAMGVPPLPKDRNLACGLHKQEIIKQLRQLAKSDLSLTSEISNVSANTCVDHDHSLTEQHFFGNNEHYVESNAVQKQEEETYYPWFIGGSKSVEEGVVPSTFAGSKIEESNSEFLGNAGPPQVPVSEPLVLPDRVPIHEFPVVDRDSAISRYKEKRRNRRYEKHIRYESRKTLAEGRIRVKGRFAKLDPANTRP